MKNQGIPLSLHITATYTGPFDEDGFYGDDKPGSVTILIDDVEVLEFEAEDSNRWNTSAREIIRDTLAAYLITAKKLIEKEWEKSP